MGAGKAPTSTPHLSPTPQTEPCLSPYLHRLRLLLHQLLAMFVDSTVTLILSLTVALVSIHVP